MLQISIDIEDPAPPASQLISQIRAAVRSGELKAGDALPSIRQLADDLALNQKTVAKAYRLLERTGVIQTKGYRGSFVHPEATENSRVDLVEWVETKFQEAIGALRLGRVTDAEIRNAFNRAMKADEATKGGA
jgi:GntR family transcriptional regulator